MGPSNWWSPTGQYICTFNFQDLLRSLLAPRDLPPWPPLLCQNSHSGSGSLLFTVSPNTKQTQQLSYDGAYLRPQTSLFLSNFKTCMMVTKRKKRAAQEGSSKAILAVAVIVAITTRIANNMIKVTEGTDFKILHDSISLHSVYIAQEKIAYLKKICFSAYLEKHAFLLI